MELSHYLTMHTGLVSGSHNTCLIRGAFIISGGKPILAEGFDPPNLLKYIYQNRTVNVRSTDWK